jgi:hypothetical protein
MKPLTEVQRLLIAIATVIAIMIAGYDSCRGQQAPAPTASANADHARSSYLARVCAFEADRRLDDCRAIFFVAVKRARMAGIDAIEMLHRYSTFDRSRSKRAARIRREEPPAVLGTLAARLLAGELADPCPRARHWGGKLDHAKPGMIPVRCSRPTANTFYAMVRR